MISLAEKYLLMFSVPLYTVVILLEIIMSNWQVRKFYSVKETIMNVYMTLANMSVDFFFRGVYLVVLFLCYEFKVVNAPENMYVYWGLLFILQDLAFYVEHTVDHSSRLFWAVHVTHHSSPEFNLSTGFRSSVLQPLYRFIYFVPIVFLGFQPIDILFMFSLTQVYGILVHTQYIQKMPAWFESVLVSPSHHRVHHASNVLYLDKNMGMVLIIWDKLFGTYQPEVEEEPVKFGITTMPQHPFHPVKSITHEFSNIVRDVSKSKDLNHKLNYIFKAPGWSHDGSTKTSKELQRELATKSQALADNSSSEEYATASMEDVGF
ncbi:MAG: sterol desaturase family protein [Bacteroidetes bacterium]|nr:sterol desaturase family protein [Bacteroidota bacterium]